jgi:hypothetical protein
VQEPLFLFLLFFLHRGCQVVNAWKGNRGIERRKIEEGEEEDRKDRKRKEAGEGGKGYLQK